MKIEMFLCVLFPKLLYALFCFVIIVSLTKQIKPRFIYSMDDCAELKLEF